MKTAVSLLCFALTTHALAAPVLVGEYYTSPSGKLGVTVSIDWNDSSTASGYFALTATSTHIVQPVGFATFSPNTFEEAHLFIPWNDYRPINDSWWYAGNGTPFTVATPPFGGVDFGSGNPGSDRFSASFGTAPNLPVSGATPILHLVTSDPEGDVQITGVVSRLGVDYAIDQTFAIPEPESLLLALAGFSAAILAAHRVGRRA